ncbi:MAG: winged helix-turn-helix transcriptional regulator [Verrucomicrobiaceae bacterium]|nr:MAG: winged helix-turn-helix transcriptional regulator [Verrucomicrobiaceae bacterium]
MDDYLEQILHLIEEKGYARAVDVSKNLGISQASVTNMLQRLDAEGLVKHEKYRGTVLTEEGLRIAKAIVERHETLTRFLRLFGIDEETIYHDVEGMEHHVSREWFRRRYAARVRPAAWSACRRRHPVGQGGG